MVFFSQSKETESTTKLQRILISFLAASNIVLSQFSIEQSSVKKPVANLRGSRLMFMHGTSTGLVPMSRSLTETVFACIPINTVRCHLSPIFAMQISLILKELFQICCGYREPMLLTKVYKLHCSKTC